MTIIKYYEWLKIFPDERRAIYELCERDPEKEDGYRTIKKLKKSDALKRIRENSLAIVHDNKYGTVWEDII